MLKCIHTARSVSSSKAVEDQSFKEPYDVVAIG